MFKNAYLKSIVNKFCTEMFRNEEIFRNIGKKYIKKGNFSGK